MLDFSHSSVRRHCSPHKPINTTRWSNATFLCRKPKPYCLLVGKEVIGRGIR